MKQIIMFGKNGDRNNQENTVLKIQQEKSITFWGLNSFYGVNTFHNGAGIVKKGDYLQILRNYLGIFFSSKWKIT